MKSRGRYWFLIFTFLAGTATAQHIIDVDDAVDERNFMPYELPFFTDTTGTLTLQDVASKRFASRFVTHESYQNKDFRTNTAYWIRLPIRHNTETKKIWLLEFY